jgi:hypothetical protein
MSPVCGQRSNFQFGAAIPAESSKSAGAGEKAGLVQLGRSGVRILAVFIRKVALFFSSGILDNQPSD